MDGKHTTAADIINRMAERKKEDAKNRMVTLITLIIGLSFLSLIAWVLSK